MGTNMSAGNFRGELMRNTCSQNRGVTLLYWQKEAFNNCQKYQIIITSRQKHYQIEFHTIWLLNVRLKHL